MNSCEAIFACLSAFESLLLYLKTSLSTINMLLACILLLLGHTRLQAYLFTPIQSKSFGASFSSLECKFRS